MDAAAASHRNPPMNPTRPNTPGLPPTRRRFLTTASTLGAALAAAPLARAQPAAAAPKVKLGVIGCGGRGAWIANLFREHGGYEIHAVADYFPEVAEAAGNALGVAPARRFSGLGGFRRVIESGVAAVALETPPWFFPGHVQAAVDARLHVFMAKPVAVDVPGCLAVEAAAAAATAAQRCFLVDYQMPTDPHVLECARRFRDGAVPAVSVARSCYYGDRFDDPPLTATIESRLRSLVWVNDVALGGGYHVNACIHPVQAMMWLLGRTPVAATGVSTTARPDPHGDSHDVFALTYEFDDGLLWSHTGRHVGGTAGPDDPLATCELLGQAYLRIGYGGRAFVRGGPHQYAGGTIDDLYRAGAARNIAAFHQQVTSGDCANATVPMAVASCLATILGREACLRKGRMTMDDLRRENRSLGLDLAGLKT